MIFCSKTCVTKTSCDLLATLLQPKLIWLITHSRILRSILQRFIYKSSYHVVLYRTQNCYVWCDWEFTKLGFVHESCIKLYDYVPDVHFFFIQLARLVGYIKPVYPRSHITKYCFFWMYNIFQTWGQWFVVAPCCNTMPGFVLTHLVLSCAIRKGSRKTRCLLYIAF